MSDIEHDTARAELRGRLRAAAAILEGARKLAEEMRVPVAGALSRIEFELVEVIAKTTVRE